MRGRLLLLALLALITGAFLYRHFLLPQPMIAFNPDNLILQQESPVRLPGGTVLIPE